MNLQTFLICLMAVSVLTGLVTEGIKNTLAEWGHDYRANTLAGVVAAVLAVLAGVAYCVLTSTVPDGKLITMLVALVLLSWLCAMVGYDKVVQAITQFTQSHKPGVEGQPEQDEQTQTDKTDEA